MTHTHDAEAVANRLIELANEDGNQLTLTQVMNLVYFCHAWMLGLYNRPLIKQPIEAWCIGPIIQDIYQKFKKYHGNPIRSKIRAADANFDHAQEDLIKQVYTKYGYLSGIRLFELTQEADAPWDRVWRRNRQNSIIPRSFITDYYSPRIVIG